VVRLTPLLPCFIILAPELSRSVRPVVTQTISEFCTNNSNPLSKLTFNETLRASPTLSQLSTPDIVILGGCQHLFLNIRSKFFSCLQIAHSPDSPIYSFFLCMKIISNSLHNNSNNYISTTHNLLLLQISI
jgi:hypothetical protein